MMLIMYCAGERCAKRALYCSDGVVVVVGMVLLVVTSGW